MLVFSFLGESMKTITIRDTKGRKVATIVRFPKKTPLVSVVDNNRTSFPIKLPLD
jgi:hypothetical protein